MIKIMPVFGTRPEAIKLAPVIRALQGCPWARVVVCVTAQHRELLDQVLKVFDIRQDHDLDIMTTEQDLYDVTYRVLMGLRELLCKEKPDLVLVPSKPSHGVVEATSIAAIEAMACGTPVIVSAIGGLAELVTSGYNGLTVPADDVKYIANTLLPARN